MEEEDSKAHQDRQETKDRLDQKETTDHQVLQGHHQAPREVVDRQGLANQAEMWQWTQTSLVNRPLTLHLHLPK